MKKNNKVKIWIILWNILFGLLFFPAIAITGISVMIFDSPGAVGSIYSWNMFFSIASIPILIIGSVIFAWSAYRIQNYKTATLFALLPLLGGIWVVFAIALVQKMCDGQFSCQGM